MCPLLELSINAPFFFPCHIFCAQLCAHLCAIVTASCAVSNRESRYHRYRQQIQQIRFVPLEITDKLRQLFSMSLSTAQKWCHARSRMPPPVLALSLCRSISQCLAYTHTLTTFNNAAPCICIPRMQAAMCRARKDSQTTLISAQGACTRAGSSAH